MSVSFGDSHDLESPGIVNGAQPVTTIKAGDREYIRSRNFLTYSMNCEQELHLWLQWATSAIFGIVQGIPTKCEQVWKK